MTDKSVPADGEDITTTAARRLIPGAYERKTPTHRQPGSMGGGPFGANGVSPDTPTMSPATAEERRREGGGGAAQRRGRSVVESR